MTHVAVPVLVRVITPVIVPAAPIIWPADAEIRLHGVDATDVVVEVVEVAAVVLDVVVDELVTGGSDVVVVVVVRWRGVGAGLLHATRPTLAPAPTASATRRVFTSRSPRDEPNREIRGTVRPTHPACPLPPRLAQSTRGCPPTPSVRRRRTTGIQCGRPPRPRRRVGSTPQCAR